ncbi:diguanylate cyclase domain-containing protein, partial [Rhizobium johnstonii]
PITVSIGVATSDEDGIDFTAVLTAADGSLYAAKKSGRNCVVGRSGVVKLS